MNGKDLSFLSLFLVCGSNMQSQSKNVTIIQMSILSSL